MRIQTFLRSKKINQRLLAEKLGMPASTLSEKLSGNASCILKTDDEKLLFEELKRYGEDVAKFADRRLEKLK